MIQVNGEFENNDNQGQPVDFSDFLEKKPTKKYNEGKTSDISLEESLFLDAPKIVRLIIKYSGGLIKNDKQAEHFLMIFVVVIFLLGIFIFYKAFSFSSVKLKPEEAKFLKEKGNTELYDRNLFK